MKVLKFILVIFLWLLLIAATAVIIHYRDYNDAYKALAIKSVEPLSFLQTLTSYFAFTDQWNKIYSAIIVIVLMALFAVNDHWLRTNCRKFFHNLYEFSYPTAVLGWMIMKAVAACMVLIEFIIVTYIVVVLSTHPQIIENTTDLTPKTYGLLLGANKKINGSKADNLYYLYRIDAAEKLYKSGKVQKLILSGDNNMPGYNEPLDMKRDLELRGVPAQALILDYAGFRTLDSVVRLKYHFGVTDVVIISQKFHLERALFLAWFYDINAAGYAAQGTMTKGMWQREALAKPKTILDIFVFNMQPKFGKAAARDPLGFSKPKEKALIISVVLLLAIVSWFFVHALRFGKI